MKSRFEFESNFDWLYYLQNNLGQNDLEIQPSWTNEKGELCWGKRKNFLKLAFEDDGGLYWISRASHRSILDIEIVLDIDELHPKFKSLKEQAKYYHLKLKEYNDIRYYTYFTGSKSYHIHIFLPMLKFHKKNHRELLKKRLLILLGADSLKIGRNMIAIEGVKHYKSGKPKIEVLF